MYDKLMLKLKENYEVLESESSYDPPMSIEDVKNKYPKLLKDPIHYWRSSTGIELIHKEPSVEELERIWNNWNLMTPQQKEISDKKSIELFGKTNAENYKNLLKYYK
jgi:hypothetical protein